MLQIKNLSITLRKDLRTIVENFNFVLRRGDRAVIVGEEGNGKSTLLKVIYDRNAAEYADCAGEVVTGGVTLGYLRQDLEESEKLLTAHSYFASADGFYSLSPERQNDITRALGLDAGFFYSEQQIGTLSGGERVKLQLARLLIEGPDIYLLDEPSNDIDIETLLWLEKFILSSHVPVLYVSHDETLVENTANVIIHLELVRRKTTPRHTIARIPYSEYVKRREAGIMKQTQQARKEKEEHSAKMERYRKIFQRVDHEQTKISRGDPAGGRLLKKKMHAVKSLERRFEREGEQMTQLPDIEEEIFLKFDECSVPSGKNILDLHIPELTAGGRLLASNISLKVVGAEKVCIAGKNGAGKTSLLRLAASELLQRKDIRAAYMPQFYDDMLDMQKTPVEFLAPSGMKADITRARTHLGSVKYTADEMELKIAELSGGQQAKLLLMKMILDGAEVLILDEPTRNFSPLSNPVLRGVLKDFGGAIISVSHDRKYISEVCETVYTLTENGLKEGLSYGK